MILELPKFSNESLSDHFMACDFDCKCNYRPCNFTLIDTDLIEALEDLWVKIGPIFVRWENGGGSGYRCSAHNRKVGGKPGSLHLNGKAADIKSLKVSTQDIADLAEDIIFFKHGGVGLARTFVHLDVRGYRARWKY